MSEETKNTAEQEVNETEQNNAEKVTAEKVETKPKKQKKAKISNEEKLKAEIESQKELLMRTAAEFDNYKKRTEREKLRTAEYSKSLIIKKLLPIIDNANRALVEDFSKPESVKGIEMIVRQLCKTVDDFGLEELAQVGDTFDPNIHEAVMHIDDPDKTENEIVAVLQQGYKIGDTVIRPAMVQVAN